MLKAKISSLAHSVLGKLGIEFALTKNLKANRELEKNEARLEPWRFLIDSGVTTVLDVGANVGSFAELIAEVCPGATIHCYEPLADCFAELQDVVSRLPKARAYQVALGEESSSLEMFRSKLHASSSLLPMTKRHSELWPQSDRHTIEKVEVRRLDDLIEEGDLASITLMKIDVQGYELAVIRGAKEILKHVSIIVCEINFEKLYEGQSGFDELYRELSALGFFYRGQVEQFCEPDSGWPTFADVLFARGNTAGVSVPEPK